MPPYAGPRDAALRAREPSRSRDEMVTRKTYTATSTRSPNAFYAAPPTVPHTASAALLPRGAKLPLLSELSSPHTCQTQFAACSGNSHVTGVIPSGNIACNSSAASGHSVESDPASVPSSWRNTPWLETSSSACALPSQRTSAEGASFAMVPDRIH